MGFDQRWRQKEVESYLKEEELGVEKIWLSHQPSKENNLISMKSKILALSKNEEFKSLLKQKKISNKYVTIFFGEIENKNNKKLNISFVAKKKLGNAIKRNKIKRRLRNIVNDSVKKISLKYNYSYLVIAKPTMLNNEYTIIKETLFRDLERIN